MKNSISNVWILGIVILFLLIFSGFIIITINYNKVFKMKNTVISIIEKNDGVDNDKRSSCNETSSIPNSGGRTICVGAGAVETINAYLYAMNYSATGDCLMDNETFSEDEWYGVSDLSNPREARLVKADHNTRYHYCIAAHDTEFRTKYFKVRLFFYFDLPVIGNLIPVNVDGTTDEIHKATWKV